MTEEPNDPPNGETSKAIKILMKIRKYLEDEDLVTMLTEIQNEAHAEGKKPDPFRILISTILSVRNRDESTVIATKKLFDEAGYNTPEKIAGAPVEEIEQLIRRSGMYRMKTERIKATSKMLIDEHDGEVPRDMKSLLALPGVGRKVANCVKVYAFKEPAIPVDVHVHRISNRLGLVKTKKPNQTERKLQNLYPQKYWTVINDSLVIFGKTVCKPTSPQCDTCPVSDLCPKLIKKKTKRKTKPKN